MLQAGAGLFAPKKHVKPNPSASRSPSACRWRSGWCGWQIRREAGARPPGRFPARAEQAARDPDHRGRLHRRRCRRPRHRDHQRKLADQCARAGDRFSTVVIGNRNDPRCTTNPASASSPAANNKSLRLKSRCSEPIASIRSAAVPSRRRVGTRSSKATSSSIDMQDRRSGRTANYKNESFHGTSL